MEIPVDTSQMTMIAAGGGERVIDSQSKQQRVDRRTGALVFVLPVLAMRSGAAPELLKVKFFGSEPKASPGQVVVLEGLVVSDYAITDTERGGIKSAGLSFRAAGVVGVTAPKAG